MGQTKIQESIKEWETVEPNVWKPENAEDFVVGILLNKKSGVGSNNSMAYYLETEQGIQMLWGSTVLDDRLSVVEIGDILKITYKGTKPNIKGQPTKIYKVQRGKVN